MNTPINILFMDDEPEQPVVINALNRLRDEGYEVDFFDTMSAAIQAYYDKYYDIFILDIDMHHVPDSEEGDGIKVLKWFTSLHNQTKVIMFSGAGTVKHWFAAANTHCFGYVAKDEEGSDSSSVGLLLNKVKQALASRKQSSLGQESRKPPMAGLVIGGDMALIEQALTGLRSRFPEGFRLDHISPERLLETELDEYAYAFRVLIQHEFSTRQKEQKLIELILADEPYPHAIVVCDAEDSDRLRKSILYLANAHPFRMVDLLKPDWVDQLGVAVTQAMTWYGRREIFTASDEALSRINISLPEDVLEIWQDDMVEDMHGEITI